MKPISFLLLATVFSSLSYPAPLWNIRLSTTNLLISWTVPSLTAVLHQNRDLSATKLDGCPDHANDQLHQSPI